jgi:hypothetical protein
MADLTDAEEIKRRVAASVERYMKVRGAAESLKIVQGLQEPQDSRPTSPGPVPGPVVGKREG